MNNLHFCMLHGIIGVSDEPNQQADLLLPLNRSNWCLSDNNATAGAGASFLEHAMQMTKPCEQCGKQ